jgi:hypothetical protein
LFDEDEEEEPPTKRPRLSEEQPTARTPAAIPASMDRNRVILDSVEDAGDQPVSRDDQAFATGPLMPSLTIVFI